jgi:WXG100 family type VII secretion target
VSHRIEASVAQLRATADAVAPQAAEYRKLYNKLYAEVDRMKVGWQGVDQDAYVKQIEGFREDFESMVILIENYAAFLKEAAQSYQTVQDQARSRALQTRVF